MAALKLKKFSMEEETNMQEHRTDYYNSRTMVLRRGQEFKITLQFNRPIQKNEQVEFYVATGPKPTEDHYTLAVFQLSKSSSDTYWTATTDSLASSIVNVTISSPADAPIGLYKTSLQIYSKNRKSHSKLHDFILLFNPWATDDVVFMEDENERHEYVLNDSGIIYYGDKDSIQEMGWNFGQFEDGILETCLQILNRSLNYMEDKALDSSRRGDPAYVGRVLSAMINSIDDKGVVEGNWDSQYTGGVDPLYWNGSVEILTMWRKRGYKPVKYGQCWVFGGVFCTVLRSLGIPTRVITNFVSAHDKDSNLSIDSIYTSSGKSMGKDSLWNYHVWNESWFTRSELGESYGGWQVLDATPQEISGDTYCCGPASVHAIKEGEIDLSHDGPFIFSEVNADRNTWIYYDKDVKEKVYTNIEFVGKNMSTKAVGSDERIDITENYKYPEAASMSSDLCDTLSVMKTEKFIGMVKEHPCLYDIKDPSYSLRTVRRRAWDQIASQIYPNWTKIADKDKKGSPEERAIYLKAREKLIKMGIISKDGYSKRGIAKKRRKKRRNDEIDFDEAETVDEKLDIEGKFELTSSTAFGDDISVTLTLTNTGTKSQNVNVKLSSSSIKYTGKPIAELFSDQTSLTLAPKKEKQIPVNLYASQYEEEIVNHNLIEVVALCILKSGKKMLVRKVLFIERPPLKIQMFANAIVNHPVEVEVTYTNPLSTTLSDGGLSVGGSGLVKKKMKKKVPELGPRETRTVVIEITPSRTGTKKLVVDFTSKHFSAIKGFHTINVTDVDVEADDEFDE